MQKILVLRGGALGDFIVTLPAIALLKQRWPASRLELIGNAAAAKLGQKEGLIDAVHSQHEARWSALYGRHELSPDFAIWLREFDLVLNYWPDPDAEIRARFPRRSGQVFRSEAALPGRAPAASHYCEPLRTLGLEPRSYFYRLKAGSTPGADATEREGCIAIHPGSGSPRKNWPIARWRAVCEWLRTELHATLLIVTGETERETGAVAALAGVGEMAMDLPLMELAERLGNCRLFLGHDSGVSHLAAARGVPCILLFGPTDPAMWAPPAPHVHVIKAGAELDSIPVSAVQDAVVAVLPDDR
jgi:heptosyltransferase III